MIKKKFVFNLNNNISNNRNNNITNNRNNNITTSKQYKYTRKASNWIMNKNMSNILQKQSAISTTIKPNKKTTLEQFISTNKITHVRISDSLKHFEKRFLEYYELDLYDNTKHSNSNTIFFGFYDNSDLVNIKNHKKKAFLMFGGTDLSVHFDLVPIYQQNIQFICISDNIQKRLVNFLEIKTKFANLNPLIRKIWNVKMSMVDKRLFKPVNKIGTKIYVYDGYNDKLRNKTIYNTNIVEQVKKHFPHFKFIHSSNIKVSYEEMPSIYADCFIGLRLTDNDGNANTVQELEAMNIPVVHNHSDYGLKWKTVADIVEHINEIKNDKITVIINSYKPDKNDLYNSINSCLNQKNVSIRILVSTVENDPTINYVEKLNNNKITLVISKLSEHPGRGPKGIFFQLNKALKEVKTKYFTYFSSNDIMYPNKLYNEIKLIKSNKSIFCFSRFDSYFPDTNKKVKYSYSTDKMNLVNLLKSNFINDCATIDLSKLDEPLEFNYEKYGNTAYWYLWLTLLHKYGEGCMAINENSEWKYIRDNNKSQAIKRSTDINKQELYKNQREFMLSEFDKKIKPMSLYKYENINEKFWWWNDENNTKPIELTVALPALNANKIIWLALESLKNQININFAWELIVFEEEGNSKNTIKSYAGLLPGCARIIYKTITKEDAFYNIKDIKKNNCTSYYTLLEKWINMAKISDKNSKIYVKHAVDCYSPPKRLYIHYEHFKNDMCYYSTQPKGYFYNINFDKWLLYDGYLREPVSWNANFKEQVKICKNIKVTACHLNMALRTKVMLQIKLPDKPKNRGIDGYILKNLCELINIRSEQKKIVFTDDEIDPENWKYSIDTDGYNNISLSRQLFYLKQKVEWYIPQQKYDYKLNKIHNEIINKIKKKDYFIFVEDKNTMSFFSDSLIKNYNLKIYDSKNNKKDSLIVFGLYTISEKLKKVIKDHVGDINIIWCGSDINYPENKKSIENINYIKTLKNKKIIHVAMGGIIEKKIQYFFKQNPIFYPIAPTIILNNYKPIKKGKDIYTYINASNSRIYGFEIIEKLKQKHNDIVFHVCINPKNKEYCKRKNINTDNYECYEMNKVIDVYKKCFLCLRLTNIDGNANSVLETGLLGLKTVYIDDKVPSAITYDYHNLIWSKNKSSERNTKILNAVDSISKIIENEKKNIGTCDKELANKMKDYIKWDFNSLNIV